MKYLLLCCLLSFQILPGLAQRSGFLYGLHAGINSSDIHDEAKGYSYNYAHKTGLNVGFDLVIPVSESLSVQPELSYSRLGATNKDFLNLGYREHYLVLPLLLKYTFYGTGFSCYAGPQYGYLLKGTSDTLVMEEYTRAWLTAQDHSTKSDFAAIAGIEYYLKNHIGLSARYQQGLINALKKGALSAGESFKNRAFTVTIGYRL